MHLSKIEKKLLEIEDVLSDKEREKKMASGISQRAFEGRLKQANRPLLEERAKLEKERQFIIDKRSSWQSRLVWNFLVPVLASVVTAYLVAKLVVSS